MAMIDGENTFNLLRIVDDEIAVPYNGEVHCQVTDLHTLVHVLKGRKREKVRRKQIQGGRIEERQRKPEDRGINM